MGSSFVCQGSRNCFRLLSALRLVCPTLLLGMGAPTATDGVERWRDWLYASPPLGGTHNAVRVLGVYVSATQQAATAPWVWLLNRERTLADGR
jgi:hypothetical protein